MSDCRISATAGFLPEPRLSCSRLRAYRARRRGRVVRQGPAKPRTAVRFRSPPLQLTAPPKRGITPTQLGDSAKVGLGSLLTHKSSLRSKAVHSVKPAPIVMAPDLKRVLAPDEAGAVLAACSDPIELRAVFLPLYAGVALYENPCVDSLGWRRGRISFQGHYGHREVPTHLALEAERAVILSANSSPEDLLSAGRSVARRAGIAFTFHTLLTTMARHLEAAGVPGPVRACLMGSPSARAVHCPFPMLRDGIDLLSYS
jgi:hypothetical protein